MGAGSLNSEVVGELTRPFAEYLCYGQETRLAGSIMRHIFTHLIRQTDLGIDYTEKLNAWKHVSFFFTMRMFNLLFSTRKFPRLNLIIDKYNYF